LFPIAIKLPQSLGELFAKMIRKGDIMSVTESMTLTLLVTGSLSLYLILHAAVDLYRHRMPKRDP
jgi:hypothetical protein